MKQLFGLKAHPAFDGAFDGFEERFPSDAQHIKAELKYALVNYDEYPGMAAEGEFEEDGLVELKLIRIRCSQRNPVRILLAKNKSGTIELVDMYYGSLGNVAM